MLALGLLGALPMGCVLPRRQVMLTLTTNVDCSVFDRVQIRVSRGAGGNGAETFDQTWLRNDCPPSGLTALQVAPFARSMPFQIAVVDAQRIDERVHFRVNARTLDSIALSTEAETDFVDGTVYRLTVSLNDVCFSASPMRCPEGYTCRPSLETGDAACGSIYRAPNTLGSFVDPQSIRAGATITLDGARAM